MGFAVADSPEPPNRVSASAFQALSPLDPGHSQRAALSGHASVIQFWASWCHSCGSLMWDLDRIAAESPGAQHVLVALDTGRADAVRTLDGHALGERLRPRTFLDSDGSFSAALGITAVPAVIVVDAQGLITWRGSGHLNSRDFNSIRARLAEASEPAGAPQQGGSGQ